MSTITDSNTTVPLTTTQKMWLATQLIPGIIAFLPVSFVLIRLLNLPIRGSVFVPVLLAGVLLIIIYEASKILRDLMSGVALVEEDEMMRLWQSRNRVIVHFGQFAKLGRMRMSRQAFGQGQAGQHYRVHYSPASRVVWSLETK